MPTKKAATPPPKRAAAARRTTASKHPLEHLIPEKSYYENFVSRRIEGFLDVDILEHAQETQRNVLLYGPTGPGKTSLVYAYAAKTRQPIAMLPCNGAIDPNTALGSNVMRPDGKIEYVLANLIEVMLAGGVVDFDEVNFMPPKYLAVFHSALDGRREIVLPDKQGEVIKLHPRTLLVATYNPRYEGTRPLNPAFRNRWALKIEYGYDRKVESELVRSPALLDLAEALRNAQIAGDIETPVSTNMLMEFIDLCFELSVGFAVMNFLNAFSDEERSAVQNRLELSQDDIVRDLRIIAQEDGIDFDEG